MSHELYFYVNAEDRPVRRGLFGPLKTMGNPEDIPKDDLLAFLQSNDRFTYPVTTDDGFIVLYRNKHTGTEVTFKFHSGTIHEVESRFSFPGYNYTGLSVSIEYFRPAYFVVETAPLIVAMCQRFHMFILDPQLSPMLRKCMASTIIRSWEIGNEKAINTARDNDPYPTVEQEAGANRTSRPFIPRDKLMIWWKYSLRKEELKKRVRSTAAGVYVPEWKVIRRISDKRLFFAITLAEGMGYIMPKCEAFLVKRNRFTEVGVVHSDVLLPTIQEYLKPWTFSGIDFSVLTSPDARRISKILAELELESLEEYEQIAPGSFVDVPGPLAQEWPSALDHRR